MSSCPRDSFLRLRESTESAEDKLAAMEDAMEETLAEMEKLDEEQENQREEPPTPNTSAQEDDVLNINIDENDKLDFEPDGEDVDEKILDDTKVNLFNDCYDLRKLFRTRTRTSKPAAKRQSKSIPGIMESLMIIRYFYIQLFMQQFFLYLFILRSQSYYGANLNCMLSRVFLVCE